MKKNFFYPNKKLPVCIIHIMGMYVLCISMKKDTFTLSHVQEILVVYPVDDALSPLPAGSLDLSRALKWTSLTKICFKLNNITSIDTSLVGIVIHISWALCIPLTPEVEQKGSSITVAFF